MSGYVEVNDANAILRGDMDAADGTFSGVFAADNVDAVQAIHIRDSAVSVQHILYVQGGTTDTTFAVGAPDNADLCLLTIPCVHYITQNPHNNGNILFGATSNWVAINGRRRSNGSWATVGNGYFFGFVYNGQFTTKTPVTVRLPFNPKLYDQIRVFTNKTENSLYRYVNQIQLAGRIQIDYRLR